VRHAVANELAGVVGMLELVLVGHHGPLSPGQREALTVALDAANRAGHALRALRAQPGATPDRAPAAAEGAGDRW
jgi:hypothetical protein